MSPEQGGSRGGARACRLRCTGGLRAQSTVRRDSAAGLGAGVWWERVQTPRQPVWGPATVMPPGARSPLYTCGLGHTQLLLQIHRSSFFVFFIVVKYTNVKLIMFKCTFSAVSSIGNTV